MLADTPVLCGALRDAVSAVSDESGCERLTDRRQLTDRLTGGGVETVFVARAWSITDSGVLASLPAEYPSVRFVQLLGPWCEGEGRTGQTLDGFERQFWDHPRDCVACPIDRRLVDRRLVIVASRSSETVAAIGAALAHARVRVTSAKAWAGEAPLAAVWEGTQLSGSEAASLGELRRHLPHGTPLVALLDFPRRDTVAAAKQLGATTVLRKPYDLEALHSALRPAADSVPRTLVAQHAA